VTAPESLVTDTLQDVCQHPGCIRDNEDSWGYCDIHWAQRGERDEPGV
jgi:hypothetical protein